jgi:hypothetical protein
MGTGSASKAKEEEIRRLKDALKRESAESASKAEWRGKASRDLEHKAQQLRAKRNGVDVCILMDCTGSMASWIEQAKTKVSDITRRVVELNGHKTKVRVAFVGYRDIGDEGQPAGRFEIQPFVESAAQVEAFVSRVQATGGDDAPEDIAGALAKAKDLDWFADARLIIHFGDAPCHGTKYHNFHDNYPQGDPTGLVPEVLLKELEQMNVQYFFGKINSSTDKMLSIFQRTCDEITILELGSDTSLFVPKVVDSISTSISRSRLRSRDYDL